MIIEQGDGVTKVITASELIEKLSTMHPDAQVVISYSNDINLIRGAMDVEYLVDYNYAVIH